MRDPFDGTGEPSEGASYRGLVTVLVVSITVIVLLWLAYGWALGLVPENVRPS